MDYSDPIANAGFYIYAAYGIASTILIVVTTYLCLEHKKLLQLVATSQRATEKHS